jgi:hypothetical protein
VGVMSHIKGEWVGVVSHVRWRGGCGVSCKVEEWVW